MPVEYIEVQNLKELNTALNNRKAGLIALRPEKTRSFDLQVLKKAALSGKKFCIFFSDFLQASPSQRKKLFVKYFLLFRIAKKAGLRIEVLDEHGKNMDFFAGFLGGEK